MARQAPKVILRLARQCHWSHLTSNVSLHDRNARLFRMSDHSIKQAQEDMRDAYFNGATGVVVSGAVWLTAAALCATFSNRVGVYALLAGGAFIFPLSVLLSKLLGRRGFHASGNPLGTLASESTFWLITGVAVAFGVYLLRVEWFFPAMLLAIGARYLTFQTVYGLRVYWYLGAALCSLAFAAVTLQLSPSSAALAGGLLEISFAIALFRQRRSEA